MVLDFSKDGVFHVLQKDHIKYIVSSWPEHFKDADVGLTPASLDLFEKGGSRVLSKSKSFIVLLKKDYLSVTGCGLI